MLTLPTLLIVLAAILAFVAMVGWPPTNKFPALAIALLLMCLALLIKFGVIAS